MDFVTCVFNALHCEDHLHGQNTLAYLTDVRRNPAVSVMCWQTEARITPLHWAASRGRPDLLRVLLAHPSVDVTARMWPCGVTALMLACECGEEQAVALLLADQRVAADLQGRTALWVAASRGALACVKLLLLSDKPLNLDAAGAHWDGELYTAEEMGRVMNRSIIHQWLRRYRADRASVVHLLRLEHCVPENVAANLFGLAVLVSDSYLRCLTPGQVLRRRQQRTDIFADGDYAKQLRAVRFFNAGSRLPLELQMMIGLRGAGSAREIIPARLVEHVFRTFTIVRWYERPARRPASSHNFDIASDFGKLDC